MATRIRTGDHIRNYYGVHLVKAAYNGNQYTLECWSGYGFQPYGHNDEVTDEPLTCLFCIGGGHG